MLRHSFVAAACVALLGLPLAAQSDKYNDYTWAWGLFDEFGLDERAEGIFRDMVEGTDSTPTERQQGRLGLARMKQRQARRAEGFEASVPLYEEARSLMKDALDNWPDKTSTSYYDAVFTRIRLLTELGEYAMAAIEEQGLSEEAAQRARDLASEAFGRAKITLEDIRRKMGSPDPQAERAKWRIKNRAWYEYTNVLMNEAQTHPEGSTKFVLGLENAVSELEEFIIENETDDEEAFLGALYGYITLGKVHAALGEEEDAIANISSVLDQFVWEDPSNPNYRLNAVVQALGERVYYELISYLVEIGRYERAVQRGDEMLTRWERMRMDFKRMGRAALVSAAEARLRSGDSAGALQLAARVVEEADGDATGSLANKLVAEIIATSADKSRFDPEIIRSAAKGAFYAGPEKRAQAIAYFRLFLRNIEAVEDPDTREYYAAEAWYLMGRALRFEERKLEASFAFEQGYKEGRKVSEDDLGNELAKYWKGTLNELASESRSDEIQKLKVACENYLIANPPEGGISKGDLLYSQGRNLENDAERLEDQGNLAQAISKYREAANRYDEAAEAGGPKKERALIRKARTGMDIGKLLAKQDKEAESAQLLKETKKAFRDYLAYSSDPGNSLTDPQALASREMARGEARYSISTVNDMLMPGEDDATEAAKARREELWRENVEVLEDFEDAYGDSQKSVTLAALFIRQESHLGLGEIEKAIEDYRAMAALDESAQRTTIAAYRVGAALRDQVNDRWDELIGKVYPHDEEWDQVLEKPGFDQAREKMRRALGYYRTWLEAGRGQSSFRNWNFVVSEIYRLGDPALSADMLRKAIDRFGNQSSVDPKDILSMQRKLLFTDIELAQEAEANGDAATAQALWAEAENLLEDVRSENSPYADYSSTLRAAAIVYGGYVARPEGLVRYFPAQGKFDKAADLWQRIERIEKSRNPGSERWWEAKFYNYYAVFQALKAKGQSTKTLDKAIETLKATTGDDYGGRTWKPFFNWLETEVGKTAF